MIWRGLIGWVASLRIPLKAVILSGQGVCAQGLALGNQSILPTVALTSLNPNCLGTPLHGKGLGAGSVGVGE